MSDYNKFRNQDNFQCNICHYFDRFNCCCTEDVYCVIEVEKAYQQGRADQRKEDEELNYHYQTSHECYQQGILDAINKMLDYLKRDFKYVNKDSFIATHLILEYIDVLIEMKNNN